MSSDKEYIESLEARIKELEARVDNQAAGLLEFICKHETRMMDVVEHFRMQLELLFKEHKEKQKL